MTRINAYMHLFCPWKQLEPLLFEHEHTLGSIQGSFIKFMINAVPAEKQLVAYHDWRARFLINIAHCIQWWSCAFWTDRIRGLDDICIFAILLWQHGLWLWWSTVKCHTRGSYMKYHNELYLFGEVMSAITYANCCKQTYEALPYPNTVRSCSLPSCSLMVQYQVVCWNCLSQPLLKPRTVPVLCQSTIQEIPENFTLSWSLEVLSHLCQEIMTLQQGFWCNIEIYRCVNTFPSSHEAVSQAYKFVFNCIGQDKDSSEIWYDYIQFIKAGKVHGIPTLSVPVHVILDKYHL